MKNIHLIPTQELTKLHFDEALFLSPNPQISCEINSIVEGRNIYITSDEEIKDKDYYLYLKDNSIQQFIKKHHTKLLRLDIQKKIILTTDTKLIEDGVQAIDNKFLEWFIKNSSCEEVKILRCPIEGLYTVDLRKLIPKEEVLIQSSIDGEVIWSTAKETLEEVAERILFENTNNIEIHYRGGKENVIKAMIEIAKWQQEKQDEFAIGFLNSIRDYELENGSRICFDERDSKELLEIYKKKL